MKKNRIVTLLLVLLFLVGLCLLLYPKISDYWNKFHQTRAINQYVNDVEELDPKTYAKILSDAEAYNRSLSEKDGSFTLTDEQEQAYPELLNLSGDGIMGYIEIPVIGVNLPICHGTSHAVLQTAIGHIEWSSLPIGGESTHSVLSGHRGLPSSRLFSDLDKVVVGDVFTIRVLNETYTYEVDQILIVEPEDTQPLMIEPGKDYCTLVTCTPYGINTHRILCRGHRIENAQAASTVHITADAVQIEPMLVVPILFAGLLSIALLVFMLCSRKSGGEKEDETNE